MSSPSKLFSCVEATAILKSPINNSSAKNHWSFGKDSRFKEPKVNCDSFYNIPDTKNKRKTGIIIIDVGFGYGKKTDLEFDKNPQHVVPPSNTYNLKSFVETNKHHQKGFTPRYSREVWFYQIEGNGTRQLHWSLTEKSSWTWEVRRIQI